MQRYRGFKKKDGRVQRFPLRKCHLVSSLVERKWYCVRSLRPLIFTPKRFQTTRYYLLHMVRRSCGPRSSNFLLLFFSPGSLTTGFSSSVAPSSKHFSVCIKSRFIFLSQRSPLYLEFLCLEISFFSWFEDFLIFYDLIAFKFQL